MSFGREATWSGIMPFLIIPMLISVGQILFKKASGSTGLLQSSALLSLFTNPFLVTALAIYFLATLWWVIALRAAPLSYAYAFMALSFVYVPLLSSAVLRETLGWRTILGSVFIVIGIAVATADTAKAGGAIFKSLS